MMAYLDTKRALELMLSHRASRGVSSRGRGVEGKEKLSRENFGAKLEVEGML